MLHFLLVDGGTDLSALGGSGWVGAGLLGAVLAWLLLFHLPSKDKQLRELMEAHAKQLDAIVEKHSAAMNAEAARCDAGRRESRADFQHALETICVPMARAVDVLGTIIARAKD